MSIAGRTPYEVLGVAPDATAEELKRAYRRALREAHPDAGGDAARFHAVQRAWERIGSAAARSAYDRGVGERPSASGRAGQPPRTERSTLRARSLGHPGGRARERYLALIREWAGRGVELDDPYDPALVRSAPREVRRLLARAIAQEGTATAVSGLGIGYTIWNDIDSPGGLDHVVLGPGGLFALNSEDPGEPVSVLRGEVDSTAIRGLKELSRAARALGRQLGVRFTGVLLVIPDEHLEAAVTPVGRKADAAVIAASAVPRVLRDGIAGVGAARLSLDDVFEIRGRLNEGIRLL